MSVASLEGCASDVPRGAELARVVERVRTGRHVSDASFDAIYPAAVRGYSPVHWTPVEVVLRALEMIEADENTRLLDVGSGVGKFCFVGALVSPATFVGVEQRLPLVEVAQAIASEYGVERATYVHADAERCDWSGFDALYFYNPFGEFSLIPSERIAVEARFSARRLRHVVRATRARLYLAEPGTRVVTFHGLGAPMPPGYRCLETESRHDGTLACWLRVDAETDDAPLDALDDPPVAELEIP